ncbi:MAG TPA: rhomboid family intramembrane serine protease [Xanthobacteraceae bacterium]|nr:rhomboid family intramembrane serine protease [Xanthobacteraceae bacterium]
MTTKTFGRRTAVPRGLPRDLQPARVAAAPAASIAAPSEPSAFDEIFRDNPLLNDLPYLTVGLIALLALIFWAETRFAFDIAKGGNLSVQSLIAFGAVSRDLVIGSGQWWRIGLAPLLHASISHIVGNSVALFFVGLRLEPMIGRRWFILVFVASGLGGVIGSLCGNLPGLPSVGASGAITGLVAALFVMSFNPYADDDQQQRMRKTALRFGVPALLPLAFGASGHVDYFAHAGGAIAGGALGMVICAIWSHSPQPRFARLAGMIALTGLAGSLACSAFAATHFGAYAVQARDYIPAAEMPATLQAGAERSSDLLARYPKDPRAHLLRGYALGEAQQLTAAEAELRQTLALASTDAAGGAVRDQAEVMLAMVLLEQGRRDEAMRLVASACHARSEMRRVLVKAKLCD